MLKKIGLITMADVMTKGIGYLLLPVYLGLMSKEAFGQYGFLIGGLGSIGLLLSLSLYVPFIREFSKSRASDSVVTTTCLMSTMFFTRFFVFWEPKFFWKYEETLFFKFLAFPM